MESFEQQINIEYNGTLSSRLNWHHEEVEKFVKATRLRSHVSIVNRRDRAQTNYSNLGSVLAQRQTLDPRNLLRPQRRKDDEIVQTEYIGPELSIRINDQLLTERVQKESKGRFNEDIFVKQLNGSVNLGLRQALWKESSFIIKTAWPFDLSTGGRTAFLVLSADVMKDGLTNLYMYTQSQDIRQLGGGLLFIVASGYLIKTEGSKLLNLMKLNQELKDKTHNFLRGGIADASATIRLFNLAKGNLYLDAKNPRFVTLEK